MAKAGRKTLFKEHMLEEGEKLAALGLTDEEIAWVWGKSVRSLYRWQNRHPEFSQSLKQGKVKADMNVIQSLYKKANGYEYTERHYESIKVGDKETPVKLKKEIIKQVPPDTTACIFWLKNRRKDDWRDKREVDHSGEVLHRMTLEDFRESKEQYDEETGKDLSIN